MKDYDRECCYCHKYLSIDDLYLQTWVRGFCVPVCQECESKQKSPKRTTTIEVKLK